MESTRQVNSDIAILPSSLELPGLGVLPVNAYVLKSREPVLVDTGLHQDRDAFIAELEKVIDPEDLRWIYLTHPDQDHVGSLKALMDRVPHVRLITTFLGFGIISLFEQMAPQRVYFLNPGESIDVGDRELVCLRPPTFDNPATTAVYDTKTRALFSSDCFGAVLPEQTDQAIYVERNTLAQGQTLWATVDAPWLKNVDRTAFASELAKIEQLDPVHVLSAHLPPAQAMLKQMLNNLSHAPEAQPFVGPNQAQFEAMLQGMTQGAPVAV